MIEVEILPFRPENQKTVKAIVQVGLFEHWGFLDESKNPDLNNIAEAYADGEFLVGWQNSEIVGTGAWLPRSDETVEIVKCQL